MICLFAGRGYAQTQPSSLSIYPAGVYQGEPYTMSVGNGANMTLDVQYQFNNGPVQTIYGWPSLNSSGETTVWTDTATAPGTYSFVGIRNSLSTNWEPVAASIVVWGPAPPQPTSLWIAPESIERGQSYTMTVGNGANLTLDVQYQFNFGPVQEIKAWPTLNSSGQATIWTDAQTAFGVYTFVAIRNTLNDRWEPVNASVMVTPQQPTSLSIAPSSVTAGQGSYSMFVGNGANLTLDVQYRFNGGAKQTVYGWPALNANGVANIWPGSCTVPGTYTYTDIRNTLDTQWLGVDASIVINPAPAPVVSSVGPAAAKRNSSVSVTITGSNLCGSSFSTNWPGLTFSNITSTDDTTVTATFNVSPTATVGAATVTLSARGLTTTFSFAVTANVPPTISGLSPASGGKGTSVPVVVTGANLNGATLSTTWSGLTFANVVPSSDGASVTAQFDIGPSAAVGNPPIQITTPAGSATTQAFSILETAASAKEFVYLGNKMIAVLAATAPQPPSVPANLTDQYATPTSAQVSWSASSSNGTGGLAGYKVYREGSLVSGLTPVTGTTFHDSTLAANTAYSHQVVAVDNAGNASPATAVRSIFRDDFNRANSQGLNNPSWASSGRWNVESNQARYAWQPSLGPYVWTDAMPTKIFGSFRATLRVTTPAVYRGVGLSFWNNAAGERYRVYLFGDSIYITYRYSNDAVQPGYMSAPLGTVENCTIRVEANSATRTIKVFYNDTLKITYTETITSRPNSGSVSISAWPTDTSSNGGGPVTVDDFVIEQPWN